MDLSKYPAPSRLDREIDLFIQETRDGCNDCREADATYHPGTCIAHQKLFMDLIINPKKHLNLRDGIGGNAANVEGK